jgi:predicted nucleotide-binding protein
MAKSRRPEIERAQLSVEQMRASIPKLDRRINDLQEFDINTIQERWDSRVEALEKKIDGTLQEVLGHDTVEYRDFHVGTLDTLPLSMDGNNYPLRDVHEGYQKGIDHAAMQLNTLKELFEERIADSGVKPSATVGPTIGTETSGQVFVVHGSDNAAKESVARFLATLDLEPVILHEQINAGRTIIEKFVDHADVDYAIVLFTPDDVGHPSSQPDQARPRARQNVVLELGFFMATLGRNRVCVLHKGDVEIPSDYAGVLYVPLDDGGAWRLSVAREMKSVGLDVDLNKSL